MPDELGDCFEPVKSPALISVSRLYGHSKVRVRYDIDDSELEDIKKLCDTIDEQARVRKVARNREKARQIYWHGRKIELGTA